MTYTVEPAIVEGCACAECRAGRHIYFLYQCPVQKTQWSAMSMQAYASAEDCKLNHKWLLDFGPDDTWEDGSPIVVPKPARGAEPPANAGGMVALDAEAFSKSAELLKKHWRPQDSSR